MKSASTVLVSSRVSIRSVLIPRKDVEPSTKSKRLVPVEWWWFFHVHRRTCFACRALPLEMSVPVDGVLPCQVRGPVSIRWTDDFAVWVLKKGGPQRGKDVVHRNVMLEIDHEFFTAINQREVYLPADVLDTTSWQERVAVHRSLKPTTALLNGVTWQSIPPRNLLKRYARMFDECYHRQYEVSVKPFRAFGGVFGLVAEYLQGTTKVTFTYIGDIFDVRCVRNWVFDGHPDDARAKQLRTDSSVWRRSIAEESIHKFVGATKSLTDNLVHKMGHSKSAPDQLEAVQDLVGRVSNPVLPKWEVISSTWRGQNGGAPPRWPENGASTSPRPIRIWTQQLNALYRLYVALRRCKDMLRGNVRKMTYLRGV